jgi:glyoxylase-like metal-dependent hydrolase (beta-lactamase superfamily II)
LTDLLPGVVSEIAPGIRRIVAPNPSLMTGPGTNSYLLGNRDVVAIDPGPADEGHLAAMAAAGAGRIRYVIVTHTHPDHSPGAARLGELTGATVLGFCARDGFVPDAELRDGDVVSGDAFSLRAVHTPGHASNHLCYLEEHGGLLFSGDHVMGGSTVVIAPLDGDMAQYLASLRRLREMGSDLTAIAPGHGPLMEDPSAVLDGYVSHRLAREAAILAALRARREATVDELVSDVYRDVSPALHPVARYSVWAHLRKLGDEGVADSPDPDELGSDWTAASTG